MIAELKKIIAILEVVDKIPQGVVHLRVRGVNNPILKNSTTIVGKMNVEGQSRKSVGVANEALNATG